MHGMLHTREQVPRKSAPAAAIRVIDTEEYSVGGEQPSIGQAATVTRELNVLLAYPEMPDTFWSFRHVVRLVSRRAAFPPLGLLTLAAMLPRHWALRFVDLNGGDRCVAHGKPVIAGGPLFTTSHDAFPRSQHFVLGEAEGVMRELVEDM